MDSPSPIDPPLDGARSCGGWSLATRISLLIGILGCLIFANGIMSGFAKELPWYRNLDMNIHNADDAMSLNSGLAPHHVDQPGLTQKFLLSLDHRIRHQLGLLPVWNMETLGDHPDPIAAIPDLIEAGRSHSRHMVLSLMVLALGVIYQSTRSLSACLIGAALLAGSEGLLFHGMMTRPELLCVAAGGIVSLGCVVQAMSCLTTRPRTLWLIASGLGLGFSVLSKIPGYAYVIISVLWCWVAPLLTGKRDGDTASLASFKSAVSRAITATVITAAAGLMVMYLASNGHPLDPVAKSRLLAGIGGVVLLAWAVLPPWKGRFGGYARERIRDSVMLGAGAIATFPVCLLAARLMMPAAETADYMEHVLQVVFRPDGLVTEYASNPDIAHEALLFFTHDWLHISLALWTALLVVANRKITRSSKGLVLLLLASGLGMLLLMSKRYFTLQYPVFVQVPLVVAVAIGSHALWRSLPEHIWRRERAWVSAIAAAMLMGILWGTSGRVREDSVNFQPNQKAPPQSQPLSLIFLYNHDTHTKTYLETMRNHYTDERIFLRALEDLVNNREK